MPSSIRTMQELLRWRAVPFAPVVPNKNRRPYQPDVPLVLFVPGYLIHSRPIMHPLAKRFRRAGFEVDLLLDVVFERRQYDRQLDDVVNFLVSKKTELSRVPALVLIGHGVGGLLAYEVGVRLRRAGWYRGKIIVLPLGAPFRRRKNFMQEFFLAMSLVRSGAVPLLQPHAGYEFRLEAGVEVLCVAGSDDEVVSVDRASMLRSTKLVVDSNHQGLILKKSVFKLLLRTVRSFLDGRHQESKSS